MGKQCPPLPVAAALCSDLGKLLLLLLPEALAPLGRRECVMVAAAAGVSSVAVDVFLYSMLRLLSVVVLTLSSGPCPDDELPAGRDCPEMC